ncbi:MAG: crossover junction endodeoxyribonuclease RuvC [Candidatus Paceibacterota bacterium]|jgi:crossover junction endodeoxyribonuclease RuvC
MKILGIDPGSTRAGYGVIEFDKNHQVFISGGIIDIKSKDKNNRLAELEKGINKIIKKNGPDLVGIEKLYFVKNMKTALEVAQSRGVLILCCVKEKIPILEFTPLEIKQGITGWGGADKKSVELWVKKILKIENLKEVDDVFDALAIAIVTGYSFLNNKFQNQG